MNVYCSCEEIQVWSSLSPEADLQWAKNQQKFRMAEKSFMGLVIWIMKILIILSFIQTCNL